MSEGFFVGKPGMVVAQRTGRLNIYVVVRAWRERDVFVGDETTASDRCAILSLTDGYMMENVGNVWLRTLFEELEA